MEYKPQFSIIIPVYNVENYLSKCLDSLLNQKRFTNYEIILVDDGSTDNSGELAQAYVHNFPDRVKYLLKENGGPSLARNYGLSHSQGNFTIFIDSDDYVIDSDFLYNINDILEKNTDVDYVVYNYCKAYSDEIFSSSRLQYQNNEKKYYLFEELNELFQNSLIDSPPWNKVIKSDLLKKNKIEFEHGRFSEDIDWNIEVITHATKGAYYSSTVLAYVQRSGSITKMIGSKNVFDLKKAIENCVQIYQLEQECLPSLKDYIMYQYITFLITSAPLMNDKSIEQLVMNLTKLIEKTLLPRNKQGKLVFTLIKVIGIKNTASLLNKVFVLKNNK